MGLMVKKTKKKNYSSSELDSVYLLKLVMYLIIGAQWLRLVNPAGTIHVPVPVGLLVGLLFATHDHFRVDRKIEYALLLVAMFVGFWTQAGVYITY